MAADNDVILMGGERRGSGRVVDQTDPKSESDLRRRAAWLLLMLAVVAVLLVIVIGALVHTGGKTGGGDSGQGALDPQATSSGRPAGTPSHPATHAARPTEQSSHPASHSASPSASHRAKSRHRAVGTTHCPTAATCILQGDVGGGIPAIDAYRASQGLPAVPGSVTPQAQQCALHNGDGCSGGWAETELSTPNGREAVRKMLGFARLEDPQMKSVGVGWAYDPAAKLYYFAIVRTD